MAFDGLSSRLQEITRKLRGKARISEADLKEVAKENAKNIWDMTWAEVQKYNVVSTKTGVDTGKPIPKFEELLQYCKKSIEKYSKN